jgi:gluconolactonase
VIEPDGTVLGVITTPARPSNIAWGGKDWSTLFVTARDSVYRLQTKVHGRPVP